VLYSGKKFPDFFNESHSIFFIWHSIPLGVIVESWVNPQALIA
jgi:hypothetical protein